MEACALLHHSSVGESRVEALFVQVDFSGCQVAAHSGRKNNQEYPAWNGDESLLVYDSNETGTYQVYAYRLADGVTIKLSPDKKRSDQFADFEGLPK